MNEVGSKAKSAIAAIEVFQEHFPVAFPDKSSPDLRPLTKGIDAQIKDALEEKGVNLSRTAIRLGLSRWCRRLHYINCVIKSSHRINLDGDDAELITEKEKQFAKKQRKIIYDKRKEKKLSTRKVV